MEDLLKESFQKLIAKSKQLGEQANAEVDSGECITFCLDNSVWMSAEDVDPSRWKAQVQAIHLLAFGKENNNSYSLITNAGKRANVFLSPTKDKSRLMQALDEIQLDGECNNSNALLLAQMTLRNRSDKTQNPRIIWFSGSNLIEEKEILSTSVRLFKLNGIALDIINFGEINDNKTDILEDLIVQVDKEENSHLITCTKPNLLHGVIELVQKESSEKVEESVWQKAFGENMSPQKLNEEKVKLKKKEEDEATKKAKELKIPVMNLGQPDAGGCRKVVLDRMRYKVIARQKAVPITAMAVQLSDKKVMLILSPHNSKKLIDSFKAGRMKLGEDKMVRPELAKGEVSLWTKMENLVLQWKNRKSGEVEVEVVLHPTDCKVQFAKVEDCKGSDVYLLEMTRPNGIAVDRYFFWSQEPSNSTRDKEFCFTLNRHLKSLNENKSDFPIIGSKEIEKQLSQIDRTIMLDANNVDLSKLFANGRNLVLRSPKVEKEDPFKRKFSFGKSLRPEKGDSEEKQGEKMHITPLDVYRASMETRRALPNLRTLNSPPMRRVNKMSDLDPDSDLDEVLNSKKRNPKEIFSDEDVERCQGKSTPVRQSPIKRVDPDQELLDFLVPLSLEFTLPYLKKLGVEGLESFRFLLREDLKDVPFLNDNQRKRLWTAIKDYRNAELLSTGKAQVAAKASPPIIEKTVTTEPVIIKEGKQEDDKIEPPAASAEIGGSSTSASGKSLFDILKQPDVKK